MGAECYYCAEKNGVWCKICQEVFCDECHKIKEKSWNDSEFLSPHQWYEKEILT